jgi:succinate-acetate transporter protein
VPLGLIALALTTWLLSLVNAGLYNADHGRSVLRIGLKA